MGALSVEGGGVGGHKKFEEAGRTYTHPILYAVLLNGEDPGNVVTGDGDTPDVWSMSC